jgi:hypothetical protein
MGRPARIADSAILRAGQARLTFKQLWRGENDRRGDRADGVPGAAGGARLAVSRIKLLL